MIANGYRQDSGIGTYGNMIADLRRFPFGLIAAGRTTFTEQVVDEHGAMTYETIIAYSDQLANKTVRLHPRSVADGYFSLNFSKRAYETIITNGASIDVDGLYEL